jgi:hypothetical protein
MLLGEKSMSKRAERDNYSRMCARREAATTINFWFPFQIRALQRSLI